MVRNAYSATIAKASESLTTQGWNVGVHSFFLPPANGFKSATPNSSWASRVVNSTSQRAEHHHTINASHMALQQARRTFTNYLPKGEPIKNPGYLAKMGTWAATAPITFALITTLVRTGPCDLFAQLYMEGRTEVDWRRFWGFMIFGAVYVSVFQYYFYSLVLCASNVRKLTGFSGKGPVALSTALLDQLVHSPLLYCPAFFLCLKMVDGVSVSELPGAVFDKWSAEVVEVCKASCILWIPAQMVNFYFMPPHMVVPFINAVGVIWVVWLSLNEGKSRKSTEEAIVN
eukprot:CAMPEP_0196580072 /NCGR_PEP_ID=MMETSP1081-20130531/26813_1 /TAXON_ID=36882 /ORGANISM="Pyramimonas amylifera, Strain CCMP720" /LENGTH=286 /DNA_ID=CAMNT_0041899845 /DNA_START=114 /DNA_END=974 /DNA_ORIENTATION=+